MTRTSATIAAAIAVFVFAGAGAPANAQAKERHGADRRLAAVSVGVGAASTAGYFAINDWRWKWDNGSGITHAAAWGITTIGCAALSPMVATVVLDRPLAQREGHVLIASCVLPFVGGWLVNMLYDAHPQWEADATPQPHWQTPRRAKK